MATRKTATNPRPLVARQRAIQRSQDARDRAAPASRKKTRAVQAGDRAQPDTLPGQHLAKPGREKDMALRPRYTAPGYIGSGKLAGFSAIVTGGDSGIGRAVAVLFAREGADVAIVYLDEDADAKETQAAVEAEGRRCLLIRGDVRRTAFCERAVARTVKAFGRLDVLVNNAAFQMHAETLEDIDDARIDLTLQTNIGGYMRMARAALPHMKNGASIVNTGSRTGLQGSRNLIDYSATKGAIHAFTKALALNVIDRGIRVNAVAPGPVWTPLNPADKKPADVRKFGKETDFKRVAQPEELSPAYVFLASPVCAGYITGIVLPVTGSVAAI
ncbi:MULTISPECIES: SDR family oxidoreductase [unclassified Variovorax]|uniref:SDR family oxidoreductase n=1 Tax=unclassified Variovorax TaxID=663243 RepID=UPI0025758EDF|nr:MULTISPECIES: SDR family oxidoreductase [unclassified Variovorax]MDM0089823.1 SDR family oxidoreductase [Variovorax sp. J22G40]MDM0148511.1 SDR family oxidoreductase [Variovorax sp. J2P1-31]